jgi:hypothetical protein
MKNINVFAVGTRAAWALRAVGDFAARPAHAAAQRKRRTASTAFVDGGIT